MYSAGLAQESTNAMEPRPCSFFIGRLAMRKQKNLGFGLIEVLIAMLVTSVALLGFIAIQTKSITNLDDTYKRTQASALATEIIERIRMNRSQVATYITAVNWTGAIPTTNCLNITNVPNIVCTPAQLALYDIATVRAQLEGSATDLPLLPNGTMRIRTTATANQLEAIVAWDSTAATNCSLGTGLMQPECIIVAFIF